MKREHCRVFFNRSRSADEYGRALAPAEKRATERIPFCVKCQSSHMQNMQSIAQPKGNISNELTRKGKKSINKWTTQPEKSGERVMGMPNRSSQVRRDAAFFGVSIWDRTEHYQPPRRVNGEAL